MLKNCLILLNAMIILQTYDIVAENDPFQLSVVFHIETSYLTHSLNKMTSFFCLKCSTVLDMFC